MARKKTIRDMGMTMSEDEHRRWHQRHEGKDLTAQEHEAQDTSAGKPDEPAPDDRSVNCFAIGGGFLDYCVRQGWLIRQRHGKTTRYYVTEAGRTALADFGITKY